jgi:predicted acyl esterase
MVVCNALPPDPDIVGEGWFEEWMERLEQTPQWPGIWLRHQRRDAFWLHGSPSADYESIQCPTLLIGGWVDGYVDGMLALAENLSCPTRTVIGPWGHYRPATGVPAPTLDHLDLLARWFGHHLRGDDNAVMDMPALTVFVRTEPPYDGPTESPFNDPPTTGYWRSESSWPPPDVTTQVTPLDEMEHETTTWSGPQWVGLHAPAWDRAGIGSADSADDDAHSVCFETAPLTASFEILGTPVVEVTVTSDKSVGMVAARLIAVSPDGVGHLITRGNRNLVFPVDLANPTRLVATQPVTVRFPLMATSAVLPVGWRIRLALAGADFPVVWPPGEKAELYFDSARSHLILPTVPSRVPETTLSIPASPPPPSPPGSESDEAGDTSVERRGELVTYQRKRSSTEYQPERAELTMTSEETWTISVADDDPASTRVRSLAQVEMRRPDWAVATKGSLELSADADYFHLSIGLTALHDGEVVFSRTCTDDVPREWA